MISTKANGNSKIDINLVLKEIEEAILEKEQIKDEMIKMYKNDFLKEVDSINESESDRIAKKIQDKFNLIDNPTKIYKNVNDFKKYISSYFDSVLLIGKEMVQSKNVDLFYSYLFMVSHYIELVIKTVLLNKNDGVPSNHKLVEIFTNNKDYLFEIGFKTYYFDYCIEQLMQISQYAANSDFSMCFRFPLDKKFDSKIVTTRMMNIKYDDIKIMVNNHRELLIIFQLMIILSEKDFYKKVYDFSMELLKEIKGSIKN